MWRLMAVCPHLAVAGLGIIAALCSLLGGPSALGEEIHRGGTLSVAASSSPRSLINQVDTAANSFALAAKYLEPLVELDAKGEFAPRLATAWTVSDDGLTWTFSLRAGVTWHDGKPFTAEDVKWNMDHVWKRVWPIKAIEAVSSATVVDPLTVVFQLAQPVAAEVLLASLAERAFVVAPQGFQGVSLEESPQNQMPTGTGPYKVTEYVKGQYIMLERNPHYWREGRPYLDRIVWRLIDDPNTRSAALESGQLDLVPSSALPLSDIARMKSLPNLVESTKGFEAYVWRTAIQMNFLRPQTGSLEVREAIAHAIDKQKFTDLVYQGQGKPMDSPLPDTSRFFNPDVPRFAYDPKLANQLLDDAGFKRGKDGTRFALTMLAPPYLRGEMERAQQFISQSLKPLGISVTMEIPELVTYLRRVFKDHDYDLNIFTAVYIAEPCMSDAGWYSSEGFKSGAYYVNASGIQDPAIDAALARACTVSDEKERAASFKEFQRLATAQLPILTLVQQDRVNVYSKRVRNVGEGSLNWFYSSWDNLWLAE